MGQQKGLEHQHDQPQHRCCGRTEEDRRQAGACHVAAAATDRGNLQRGDDEYKRARHSQQKQCLALFPDQTADGRQPPCQEGQAQRPPRHTVHWGQVSLHDVHSGSPWDGAQDQRQSAGR